jgi:hypothetical protein
MFVVRKDNSNKLTNNFSEKEVYDASFGDVGSQFEISDITLRAWQVVRDYFGVPIKLTATYRTAEWDISKGRSGNGQHPKRTAIDGAFIGSNADETQLKFHAEIDNKGNLYNSLREMGVTGIGLYDNFNHLDSRDGGGKQSDNYGTYAFWDSRTWTKKKS